MYLNITIQYINIRFSAMSDIFCQIWEGNRFQFHSQRNQCIYTMIFTHSATPLNCEKHAILDALLTVGSGLFSAWCF